MSPWMLLLLLLTMAFCTSASAAASASNSFSFKDSFDIMGAEDHFKASPDGQVWYLYLDQKTGCGFQTKQRYRFGWFSMKLKLVGGDSAGVVTAYYMCSDLGAGPERDELDFEFLGTGQGSHTQFKPMCSLSTGADPCVQEHGQAKQLLPESEANVHVLEHLERGRLGDAGRAREDRLAERALRFILQRLPGQRCQWKDPFPACASTTTDNWWDQYGAWVLDDNQREDFSWVGRNLVIYDYCKDYKRYPTLPPECSL
uniref:Xyloglucan endotransglucosylase/hydrolase n=1 Tax=Ananas comosus var. bracteatus TaxID=296719 RepID=A0A6V7NKS1_ANACO|nr:unnamed protein product [Ananas comosus var. bracteatus]